MSLQISIYVLAGVFILHAYRQHKINMKIIEVLQEIVNTVAPTQEKVKC